MPALDDAAVLHHHDAVGHVGDHTHVVGDQHDACVDPLAQVAHQLEDLGLDGHVECRGGLVGDQQLGLAGQRLRDHRALPLATGELVREGVEAPLRLGDLHQRQQLDGPRLRLLGRHDEVRADGLHDLEADRVDRVHRRHRLLEDDRDLRPRTRRSGAPVSPTSSLPLSFALPVARPLTGSRPSSDIDDWVLPEPDSPTMASTSPAST